MMWGVITVGNLHMILPQWFSPHHKPLYLVVPTGHMCCLSRELAQQRLWAVVRSRCCGTQGSNMQLSILDWVLAPWQQQPQWGTTSSGRDMISLWAEGWAARESCPESHPAPPSLCAWVRDSYPAWASEPWAILGTTRSSIHFWANKFRDIFNRIIFGIIQKLVCFPFPLSHLLPFPVTLTAHVQCCLWKKVIHFHATYIKNIIQIGSTFKHKTPNL